MNKVEVVSGRGIPLVGNDIDTDRIIPARFLRCVTFDGLGEQVFTDDRTALAGQHPFDQPHYQGASILIVNGNFGCGSSREHAPQAIARWGINAIIGESFAEIFFGNCVALGLPCVTADSASIKQLQDQVAADPQGVITVNLTSLQAQVQDPAGHEVLSLAVAMGEGPRQMLTTGTWDACGQLIDQIDQVRATANRLPYLQWERTTV